MCPFPFFLHLAFVMSFSQSLVFKGVCHCPVPLPSDDLNINGSSTFLTTMNHFVNLLENTSQNCPLFRNTECGSANCSVRHMIHVPSKIFYVEQCQTDCPLFYGEINPGSGNSYRLSYFYKSRAPGMGNELDCLTEHVFDHKVHLFLINLIFIYWICLDGSPHEGYYDEGLVTFRIGEADSQLDEGLDQLRDFLKFNQIKEQDIALWTTAPDLAHTWNVHRQWINIPL